MRRLSVDYGTLWVCQCCMLAEANGECCADNEHGGDGIAPWSDVDFARFAVWMGLAYSEHEDGCVLRETGERPNDYECDCERREFSSSRCEGCGSWLAGYRHAFGLTRERQRFVRPVLPA